MLSMHVNAMCMCVLEHAGVLVCSYDRALQFCTNCCVGTYYRGVALSFCDTPSPPTDGSIESYVYDTEAVALSVQCNDGYVPSAADSSSCVISDGWTPAPETHGCYPIFGKLYMSLWHISY